MPTLDQTLFSLTIDGLPSPAYVVRFQGTEGLSEPFLFEVLFSTDDHEIQLAKVVGKNATLTIQPAEGAPRHISGIVSRFRHIEDGKNVSVYQATIVPKLWRTRHRQDSRIFQEMAVPDILKKVLDGAGLSGSDYRLSLSGSYSPREYCVQHREADLTFLSRLMEEEGIYYFFEHSDSGHTLVIADSKDASAPIASPATIAFRPTLGAMAHSESVSRFSCTEEVLPGKVTISDFNFKKPSLSLEKSASGSLDSDLEVYDFPGEYDLPGDGATLAKVRLEEWQARRVMADGQSGCIRFTPGYTFTLADRARDEENREYLLTRVEHRGSQPQMGEAATGDTLGYSNTFQCMPSDVPYRPERKTPRPSIKGVQTAIVTGPSGEEVHTDEHGRVKVHFHWDRTGPMDDKSSCWIRVSQIWAGAGWGAMWIPRIGHEVVVDFIEGDPDRPLIVGRVYHGTNVPPYPLPAEKTKSTIKSNSSKGGGGSNELRFEDKKGQEEIFLHGQKDWNTVIEHDRTEKIGNDVAELIGHDESRQVDNDQTQRIKHDQKERIDNDRSISIGVNDHLDVGGDRDGEVIGNEIWAVGMSRTVAVAGPHTETVGASQSISVGGPQSVSVGASMSVSVGGSKSETIGAGSSESVAKGKSEQIGQTYTLSVGKNFEVKVEKDAKEEVHEKKTLIVGKKLAIQCGDATITIEKNGNITVQGKKLVVKGEGPIQVEGKKLHVKSENAVNVEASGKIKVKGSQVGIN
jgi:type VI secretion system secreted protein VgrG